jgi:hypothetical protein
MASSKRFTAVRRGYAVTIRVKPGYLTEEKAARLQTDLANVLDTFEARHQEIEVLNKPTNPNEMPAIKTIQRKMVRDWHVWRCNYRLTQRTKCPMKIEGPNIGPVQRSAQQHWAKHLAGNNGAS